jgi:hypothetical protein
MTLAAGTDSIETARLRLRRMTWDDLAFLPTSIQTRMWPDTSVMASHAA